MSCNQRGERIHDMLLKVTFFKIKAVKHRLEEKEMRLSGFSKIKIYVRDYIEK